MANNHAERGNEKKGQSLFLILQRRPPASPFFFHAGGQRAARPAPRQSRRHRDFALATVEEPTGNVNQSTGDAVHVRSKGDRVRKRNGRRGRGGDPRRLQLCGDEVRRERNLHRRVSKKRGFIGASAPSFFIRNVRPADSCYIRLTRLLGQVVSHGLQFLHNRRAPPTAHRRRRAPIHTAPPHHRPTTADSHHPHRSAVAAALPLRADPDRARCRILPIRPRSATALNRRSCPLLPLRLTGTPDLARSHFCRFSTVSLSPGVFQTSPTPDPPPETKNRSKSTSFANAWQVRTI